MRAICLIHFHQQRHTLNQGLFLKSKKEGEEIKYNYHTGKASDYGKDCLDVQIIDFMKRDQGQQIYRETKIVSVIDNSLDIVPPVVMWDPKDFKYYAGELSSNQLTQDLKTMYVPPVIAESV